MSTKLERMSAAGGKVSKEFATARKPRPERKAFTVLAGEGLEGTAPEGDAPGDVVVEVAEAVAVLTSATDPLDAPVGDSEALTAPEGANTSTGPAEAPESRQSRSTKTPDVPNWKTLCTPPARRGTAGQQRRFNIPIPYTILDRINTLDAEQMLTGGHKINRSSLFAAAVTTYAANPSFWVGEWDTTDTPPATTSLQGRVSDEVHAHINRLRYLDENGAKRAVNPGPVLALIITRILR